MYDGRCCSSLPLRGDRRARANCLISLPVFGFSLVMCRRHRLDPCLWAPPARRRPRLLSRRRTSCRWLPGFASHPALLRELASALGHPAPPFLHLLSRRLPSASPLAHPTDCPFSATREYPCQRRQFPSQRTSWERDRTPGNNRVAKSRSGAEVDPGTTRNSMPNAPNFVQTGRSGAATWPRE